MVTMESLKNDRLGAIDIGIKRNEDALGRITFPRRNLNTLGTRFQTGIIETEYGKEIYIKFLKDGEHLVDVNGRLLFPIEIRKEFGTCQGTSYKIMVNNKTKTAFVVPIVKNRDLKEVAEKMNNIKPGYNWEKWLHGHELEKR